MDRVIASNSVAFGSADTAPGAGTPQYFTNGNPGLGVPPTVVPGYWLNSVMDEIVNVITAAGNAADKADWTQLATALSGSIANVAAVAVTNADVVLSAAQYRCAVISFSGVLTGNHNVTFPVKGRWTVENKCTGAFTLTCKTAGGTGITIAQGCSATIYADGTNIKGKDLSASSIVLPSGAGSTGAPLVSGGGGAMTWGSLTGSGNFVLSAGPTLTGIVNVQDLTASGLITTGAQGLSTASGTTGNFAENTNINLYTPPSSQSGVWVVWAHNSDNGSLSSMAIYQAQNSAVNNFQLVVTYYGAGGAGDCTFVGGGTSIIAKRNTGSGNGAITYNVTKIA